MKTVIVKTDELINIVRENRDNHRSLFEEALEGYRKQAEDILKDHIERIRRGKVSEVRVYMPAPQDHTKDYDRVIKMLEMTLQADQFTVELDQSTFSQYVQDDWSWKDEFVSSYNAYSMTGGQL